MSVSPPGPAGPQLNALRAFEAAARLGGFKAAAVELCVTPGAVSQQVKALEQWVGSALFKRQAQGVQLTALGRSVIAEFTEAFDMLGRAQRKMRAGAAMPEVHIAALPAVAQLWLGPRMPQIRAQLPHTRISVTALEMPPNLDREMYDLSLFVRDPVEVADGIVLADDGIMPVCSPSLAPFIESIEDLNGQTLLQDLAWSTDWDDWYALSGAGPKSGGGTPARPGPAYSLYALAVAECVAGAGMLIGHKCLIGDHLDRGDLIAPIGPALPTGRALVLERAKPVSAVVEAIVVQLGNTGE